MFDIMYLYFQQGLYIDKSKHNLILRLQILDCVYRPLGLPKGPSYFCCTMRISYILHYFYKTRPNLKDLKVYEIRLDQYNDLGACHESKESKFDSQVGHSFFATGKSIQRLCTSRCTLPELCTYAKELAFYITYQLVKLYNKFSISTISCRGYVVSLQTPA